MIVKCPLQWYQEDMGRQTQLVPVVLENQLARSADDDIA